MGIGFKISWLLKTNALLLGLFTGVMVFGCSHSIFAGESPFAMLGGILFTPFFVALGVCQFKAVFGKNLSSASAIYPLHFIICAFILFGLVSALFEGGLDDLSWLWELRYILLLPFAYFLFSGIISLKWHHKLKEQEKQSIKPESKKLILVLIFLYILFFAVGGIEGYKYGRRPPEIGEHVESVEWLPDSASDICYYRSYFYTAYEFNIPLGDFVYWAEERGWELSPIKEEGVWIGRYLDGRHYREKYSECVEKERIMPIREGYYYSYLRGDGGGEDVVYDSKKGRAYYKTIPR